MHLYFAIKGIKMHVDQFITELQGKYMSFNYKNKDGTTTQMAIPLSVRPIQLYEIGYPKEHHDIVCNSILGEYKNYKGVIGNDGEKATTHKWANRFISWGRKLLHLDPIPEWKNTLGWPIFRKDVLIVGLGTKQDYTMPDGNEGI